jgi:nucleotide-binding universal stress UspA family protein
MAEQYRQDLETFKMAVRGELVADRELLQKAGYEVSAAVHFGSPVDEIVNEVENGGIHLVALATHGRKGLGRLLLGSVAESTLRKLSVPLFMIRPEGD